MNLVGSMIRAFNLVDPIIRRFNLAGSMIWGAVRLQSTLAIPGGLLNNILYNEGNFAHPYTNAPNRDGRTHPPIHVLLTRIGKCAPNPPTDEYVGLSFSVTRALVVGQQHSESVHATTLNNRSLRNPPSMST